MDLRHLIDDPITTNGLDYLLIDFERMVQNPEPHIILISSMSHGLIVKANDVEVVLAGLQNRLLFGWGTQQDILGILRSRFSELVPSRLNDMQIQAVILGNSAKLDDYGQYASRYDHRTHFQTVEPTDEELVYCRDEIQRLRLAHNVVYGSELEPLPHEAIRVMGSPRSSDDRNPVAIINEAAQAHNLPVKFTFIENEGGGFSCQVDFGENSSVGVSRSKKLAKRAACLGLLEHVPSTKRRPPRVTNGLVEVSMAWWSSSPIINHRMSLFRELESHTLNGLLQGDRNVVDLNPLQDRLAKCNGLMANHMVVQVLMVVISSDRYPLREDLVGRFRDVGLKPECRRSVNRRYHNILIKGTGVAHLPMGLGLNEMVVLLVSCLLELAKSDLP